MSLNWSLHNIKNLDEVCYIEAKEDSPMEGITKGDTLVSPVTNALIWATMAIDLGRITEKNVMEFWGRLSIFQSWHPFLNQHMENESGWGPRLITLEEVKAHIGLSTNVSDKTRLQWNKRFMENRWREVEGR